MFLGMLRAVSATAQQLPTPTLAVLTWRGICAKPIDSDARTDRIARRRKRGGQQKAEEQYGAASVKIEYARPIKPSPRIFERA